MQIDSNSFSYTIALSELGVDNNRITSGTTYFCGFINNNNIIKEHAIIFTFHLNLPFHSYLTRLNISFKVNEHLENAVYSIRTLENNNITFSNISLTKQDYLEFITIGNDTYARIDLTNYLIKNRDTYTFAIKQDNLITMQESLKLYSDSSLYPPIVDASFLDDTYSLDFFQNKRTNLNLNYTHAGNLTINLRNGTFQLYKELIKNENELHPLSIGLMYDSTYAFSSLIDNSIDTSLPKGWKWNVNEYLIDHTTYYHYYDNNYHLHKMIRPINDTSNTIFYDENGTGLLLTINTDNNVISDSNDNTITFDKYGKIISRSYKEGIRTVTISYVYELIPNTTIYRLKRVINSAYTCSIEFIYEGNNIYLDTIKGIITISKQLLTDNSYQIVSMTDSFQITSNYSYSSSNTLSQIYDANHNHLSFQYDAAYSLTLVSYYTDCNNQYNNQLETINTYELSYELFRTIVTNEKNISYLYEYDEKGFKKNIYEIKDNKLYLIEKENEEDYINEEVKRIGDGNNYTFTTSQTSSSIVIINNYNTTSQVATDSLIVTETGYHLISIQIALSDNFIYKTNINQKILVRIRNNFHSVIDTIEFYPKRSGIHSLEKLIFLDESAITSTCLDFIINSIGGTIVISSCSCHFVKIDTTKEVVNINTTLTPSIINNISFYPLKNLNQLVIDNNTINNVILSKEDYLTNLKELTKTIKCFYYNHKTCMAYNYNNATLYYGNDAISFNNLIKVGSLINKDYIDYKGIVYLDSFTTLTCSFKQIDSKNSTELVTTIHLNQNNDETNIIEPNKTVNYYYNDYGELIDEEIIVNNQIYHIKTEYSSDYNFKLKEIDYHSQTNTTLNEEEVYSYNIKGLINQITKRNGLTIAYNYQNNKLVKQETSLDRTTYQLEYSYNNQYLASLKENDNELNMIRDNRNEISSVNINNSQTLFTSLFDSILNKETITDNLNNSIITTKDEYDRVISKEIKQNNVIIRKIVYIYNSNPDVTITTITDPLDDSLIRTKTSKLIKILEYQNGVHTHNTYYSYDSLGRLSVIRKYDIVTSLINDNLIERETNEVTRTIHYQDNDSYLYYEKLDSYNINILTTTCNIDKTNHYSYEQGNIDKLHDSSVRLRYNGLNRTFSIDYTYDDYNRVISETFSYGSIVSSRKVKSYTYKEYPYSQTKTGISYLVTRYGSSQIYFDYSYTNNLISSYVITNTIINLIKNHSYQYDNLNRLIRENNEETNETILYHYDVGGNITSKVVYNYTVSTPTTVIKTVSYTYDNNYKDKLIQFNGSAISYDNNLNIISIGSTTLEYNHFKELKKYNISLNHYISFSYDAYGRRSSKIEVDTSLNKVVTHEYTYDDDSLLVKEVRTKTIASVTTTETVIYLYQDKNIIGFAILNSDNEFDYYYYEKNVTNDIVFIYKIGDNDSVTLETRYVYDAYGNVTIYNNLNQIDTNEDSYGNINPFRYKSYYQDPETNLYYLESRYYSPVIARFISIDNIEYLKQEQINGLNLYSYCNNDPINNSDPSGHFSIIAGLLIGLGIGLVSGLGYATYKDYSDNNSIDRSIGWKSYCEYGLSGALIGGSIGLGLGYLSSGFSFSYISIGCGLKLSGGSLITSSGISVSNSIVLDTIGSISLAAINVLCLIPMNGKPNAKIIDGGSFGEYDSNGNLMYRVDTSGKAHYIKKLNKYFLPHIHKFTWKIVEGVWRFVEEVLPYIL